MSATAPFRVIVFFWLALAIGARSAWGDVSGERLMRTWDREQLGVSARAWTAIEGPDGALYVGANQVLRFDGDHWETLPVGAGYAVRTLAFGRDGRLWVGAAGEVGYFAPVDSGWSAFRSLTASLPAGVTPGDVWHVFPEDDGAVFFTVTHVLRYRHGAWQAWAFPGARRLPAYRVNGEIWFHHPDSGLWTLTENGPVARISSEQLSASAGLIHVVDNVGDDLTLIGSGGLYRWSQGRLQEWSAVGSEFVRRGNATSFVRLPDGRLAIGTLSGGVGLLSSDGEKLEVVGRAQGLPSQGVINLNLGHGGTLWCSMSAHLVALDLGDRVRIFRGDVTAPLEGSYAIESFEGAVWLATDDGLVRFQDGRFSEPKGQTYLYTDLLATPYGMLAGQLGRVVLFNHGRETQVLKSKDDVMSIFPSAAPDEWLIAEGFSLSRLRRDASGQWSAQSLVLLPDAATSCAVQNENVLWVSTFRHGIFRVTRDAAQNWQAEPWRIGDGADAGATNVVAVGGDIVALTERGGYVLDRARAKFTPIAGMPRRAVVAVARPDHAGRVWLAQRSRFSDDAAPTTLGWLGRADGAVAWSQSNVAGLGAAGQVRRLYSDPTDDVWVAGTRGILRVAHPADAVPTALRAPLLRATFPDGARVAADDEALRVDLGSGEFLHRSDQRFETRLEGVDHDWSAPTNDSHLVFSGLREGSYRLDVRAVDQLGRASPAVQWSFTVLPPWYRTAQAQTLAAFVMLGCVAAGMHWRNRRTARRARELEEAVALKTAELARANAAKTEFVANMSHEIRHPISGILGLSVALEDSTLQPQQREWVSSIKSCGYLLSHLVEDVLDVAKIEAGQMTFESVPYSPPDLVRNSIEMMAAPAREAGCLLREASAWPDEANCLGDPGRVQQVLVNFITNALKFAPASEVVVAVRRTEAGRMRFEVTDHGPGIARADQPKLFTRFTRLEADVRSAKPGTGLGLALCRDIARHLGGEVGVASEPGRGSTFFLELPLIECGPLHGAAQTFLGHTRRALVVDDVEYAAHASAAIARRLGFETEVAYNALDALALLGSGRFDLALVDWDLAPDVDGAELLRRLRGVTSASRRPLLLSVTAHASDEDRRRSLAAGFDGYLAKPVTPEKLAALLEPLLGTMRPAPPVMAIADPAPGTLNLRLLADLGDDGPDGLARQLARYVTELDQNVEHLRQALEARDERAIDRATHRLAGHAQMIDAMELAATVRQWRIDFLEADGADRRRGLAEIEQAVQVLKRRLEEVPAARPVR